MLSKNQSDPTVNESAVVIWKTLYDGCAKIKIIFHVLSWFIIVYPLKWVSLLNLTFLYLNKWNKMDFFISTFTPGTKNPTNILFKPFTLSPLHARFTISLYTTCPNIIACFFVHIYHKVLKSNSDVNPFLTWNNLY